MIEDFLIIFGYQAFILGLISIFLWCYTLKFGNVSIVDRFWGIFFIVALATAWILSKREIILALVIFVPVCLWGLRLAMHITLRSFGKGEDKRYQDMGRQFGKKWPIYSLFIVFLLQITLALIISLPLTMALLIKEPLILKFFLVLGLLIFFCGFIFESVADWQLTKFLRKRKNSTEVLSSGLWSLCRHPNYFGDALLWWGLFILSVALGAPWWSIISPLLMTFLLVRVSGVSLLEKNLISSKPHYREYIKNTNAFFPWPKKKDNHKTSC